jgi:beta-1,4-mannosyl-glycoprotein beta-1,4-N-acetylglucosaminyltransferase
MKSASHCRHRPIQAKKNSIRHYMKPKLLDVFLFYNELDLLKARLEYLGPIVDQFIISEANIDFSGKPKEFLLSQELVNTLPFSNKILYYRENINLRSISWLIKKLKYRNRITRYLWKIQDAQRNSTLEPLKSFGSEDIVIFSDLDEFPSETAIHEGIQALQSGNPKLQAPHAYSLDQTFYYYNLNNAAPVEKFYGSVITTVGTFRKYLPHRLRSGKNDFDHIANGGWHFSYFMDKEKILNKIYAISDVENLSSYKKITMEEIQQKILTGSDLYDRGTILSKLEYKKIPDAVIRVIKKYLPNCAKII